MNLKNSLNEKEINLLEKAGVYVEDRDYNKHELERCAFNIQNYIMSHSLKNGDVNKVNDCNLDEIIFIDDNKNTIEHLNNNGIRTIDVNDIK